MRKILDYMNTLKRWYALITCRIIGFSEHKNYSGKQYPGLSLFNSVYCSQNFFLKAVTPSFRQWRQTSSPQLHSVWSEGAHILWWPQEGLSKVYCEWRRLLSSELACILSLTAKENVRSLISWLDDKHPVLSVDKYTAHHFNCGMSDGCRYDSWQLH